MLCAGGVLLHLCAVEIKYRKERRTLGIMKGFAQLLNENTIYCQTQNISELTVTEVFWGFFWRNRNISIWGEHSWGPPMCGANGVPAVCVISKQLQTKLAKSSRKLQKSSPTPKYRGDLLFNVIWQRDMCKKHFWSRVHLEKKKKHTVVHTLSNGKIRHFQYIKIGEN